MNLSGHPWMRHAVTGGYAQLPDIPYWRVRGWDPEDPPPEPPETPDAPIEAPPSAGLSAVRPETTRDQEN